MRNIYDIITEQKALIDVKFASHDLEYTVNYFANNQDTYYLQEGFGESIKNFVKKVIEFIKSIINKIRELVRKFISFFTKSKSNSLEDELNAKIAAANSSGGGGSSSGGGGSSSGGGGSSSTPNPSTSSQKDTTSSNKTTIKPEVKDTKKPEPKKEDKDPMTGKGTKISDLKDILFSSTLEVKTKKFGPLMARENLMDDMAEAFTEAYSEGVDEMVKTGESYSFNKAMLGALFGEKDGNLIEHAKELIGDSDEEETIKVLKLHHTIYEYITKSHSFVDKVKQAEDRSVGKLKVIISTLEKEANASEGQEQKDCQLLANFSKEAASTLGSLFNFIIQSTMRAYHLSAAIARAATDKYCRQNLHRD